MDQVYNFLKNKLSQDDTIIVAVSGGPDSMALLHILLKLQSIKYIKIVVAHVNHNVRIESEQEKEFVFNYCNLNHLSFEYMKIEEYENHKFSEADARKKRYEFFKKVMKKYSSKYLLTAHHGDDLIETILMRIVRGSTLKGYGGFQLESNYSDYTILRPLILVTKEDILTYLDSNHLDYVLDKSNESDHYTRNRYRKYILPALKKENKSVHLKFKMFSELLFEYDHYVESIAIDHMKKIFLNHRLLINDFLKLDNIIQKKILNIILNDIYLEKISSITTIHIDNILNFIKNKKDSGRIDLPNNIFILKEYGYIEFVPKVDKIDFKVPLENKNNLEDGHTIEIVDEIDNDSNFVCRLSKGEVSFPLYIRNRKVGDRMIVKNLSNSKKVSDIFINSKLSREKRRTYPLVVDNNDVIVWIPGIKKSKFDRTKEEKYDIILKYY